MAKAVWEYADAEWATLSNQERADAWGEVAAALKRTLGRFDAQQPLAKERWNTVKASLDAAIAARNDYLKKAWGIAD